MELLQVVREIPDRFLTVSAQELHEIFSGPTLIHLPGHRRPALFVSVMLHGNEDVGLKAVQKVLRTYQAKELPRELIVLVGNPRAARLGLRKLPDQDDFNRVWPGTDHAPSAIQTCMSEVVDYARSAGVFVSLDLHNNTGSNPLYGCINRVDPKTLQLATLFSRTMVYFRRPLGVQSAAMAEMCPSLTCECGKVGDATGVERASELIQACLHMLELPDHYPPTGDFHLLHTVATLRVPREASFAFGDSNPEADFRFASQLDHLNFRPLQRGTLIGTRRLQSNFTLVVTDDQDRTIHDDFLEIDGDEILLKRAVTPSMLTTNEQIVRDDCLGYLMEEYKVADGITVGT